MAVKTKKSQAAAKAKPTAKHIGLVKNDAYLEPYEDAIKGRHDHALWKLDNLTNHGKQNLPILPTDTNITDCIRPRADGCSVSGHRTPRRFISWATSTDGRNLTSIRQSALTNMATGS